MGPKELVSPLRQKKKKKCTHRRGTKRDGQRRCNCFFSVPYFCLFAFDFCVSLFRALDLPLWVHECEYVEEEDARGTILFPETYCTHGPIHVFDTCRDLFGGGCYLWECVLLCFVKIEASTRK